MNHYISAKVFAGAALHEIQEHGMARGSWLKHQITNARIELVRVSDREFSAVPYHLQNDNLILELFAAAAAVAARDEQAAIKSLTWVVASLDLLIESDDKARVAASVERLVSSVYPWGGGR